MKKEILKRIEVKNLVFGQCLITNPEIITVSTIKKTIISQVPGLYVPETADPPEIEVIGRYAGVPNVPDGVLFICKGCLTRMSALDYTKMLESTHIGAPEDAHHKAWDIYGDLPQLFTV